MKLKIGMSPSPHLWWKRVEELKHLISEVEGCGYEGIFVPDHYNLPMHTNGRLPIAKFPSNKLLDAWSMLSFIAARTERIRVGTCVTPLTRYVPSQLAKVITTVDVLSEGRVVVGLGAGWFPEEFVNYSPQGIFDEPKVRVERFLEGLQVMIELWTQNKVTFNGKYYKLKDAELLPKPKQKPHPPLWSGGLGPRMLKFTAKYFNAWLPAKSTRLTPEIYEQGVNTIKKYLKEYNRNVNEFTFALYGWITDEISLIEKYVQAGCRYYVADITPSVHSSDEERIRLIRKFAEEVMHSF
ncbi:MAG: LLM class flavin-dependent oxidoreductase [Candidatus Bathyarchaeia archaeon]